MDEVDRTRLDRPERRVSMALGSVGHLLLMTVAQNIFFLLLLLKLLPPSLAAFCSFAAISLAIDMLFFWSFFVAILTVNLRSYEIQDSLQNMARHCEGTEGVDSPAIDGFTLQKRGGSAS